MGQEQEQNQGKSKFAGRLTAMKTGFAAAKRQGDVMDGDETFPEGIFVGKVTAKLKESKKGNLMVGRMFVPTEGEMAGVATFDNLIIEHANPQVSSRGRRALLSFINLFVDGFDVGTIDSQLEETLEMLSETAPLCRFEVKHSKPTDDGSVFINITVLEALAGESATSTADVPVTPEPEPEPEATTEDAPVTVSEDGIELQAFLAAHDIPFNDEEDVEILKARIEEADKFIGLELTKDETALLVKHELSDRIVKPAPARRAIAPAPKGKVAMPPAKGKATPTKRK